MAEAHCGDGGGDGGDGGGLGFRWWLIKLEVLLLQRKLKFKQVEHIMRVKLFIKFVKLQYN